MKFNSLILEKNQNFDKITPVAHKGQRAYSFNMDMYKIPSTFFGETVIFHYPAINTTNKAVLILKGLYGQHIPVNTQNTQSWDNQLVESLKNQYNVFLFNTGRHEIDDKREAFTGKTFQQECNDVQQAFIYCKENVLKEGHTWRVAAMSFGGTILMGCPDVLLPMRGAVMIGSGCGKSPTTTKPLISTLPDTADLLKPISEFTGSLYFLHGGKDTVVPEESQKKIYESAINCYSRGWIEFPFLDHELVDPQRGISYTAKTVEKFLILIEMAQDFSDQKR